MRRLGSLLVACARQSAVPAGGALAVDREAFSQLVTQAIEGDPRIAVVREEVTDLPDGPVIVATGPLTSEPLSQKLQALCGDSLSFLTRRRPLSPGRAWTWTTASPPPAMGGATRRGKRETT